MPGASHTRRDTHTDLCFEMLLLLRIPALFVGSKTPIYLGSAHRSPAHLAERQTTAEAHCDSHSSRCFVTQRSERPLSSSAVVLQLSLARRAAEARALWESLQRVQGLCFEMQVR